MGEGEQMASPERTLNGLTVKAGAAKVDITPRVGVDLSGFLDRKGPSTGVYDRLYARALAVRQGKTTVLIISCDLLFFDNALADDLRSRISARCRVPKKNILLTAIHTHSGPAAAYLRNCGKVDRKYVQKLKGKIVQCAQKALSDFQDVQIRAAKTTCKVGVNRRFRAPDGQVIIAPNPKGVVDRELQVLIFEGKRSVVAAILNYACHAVTLGSQNLKISGDFPGYATSLFQKHLGKSSVVLFLNGADGNVNPRIAVTGDYRAVKLLGSELAQAAIRVSKNARPIAIKPFEIKELTVPLPLAIPRISQLQTHLAKFRRRLEDPKVKMRRWVEANVEWAQETLKFLRSKKPPSSAPMKVQLLKFGDAAIVALAAEAFCEIGMRIKQKSKAKYTLIAGYANGCFGYLPTKAAFAEGGYEVEDSYKFYGLFHISSRAEDVLFGRIRSWF
jgi:hypothetical protein